MKQAESSALDVRPAQSRGRELNRTWWQRERLRFVGKDLYFADRSVAELVREHGSPLTLYDGRRLTANIARVNGAFERAGAKFQLYYAIKANRFGPLLETVRESGMCGIDCCSPGEVALALRSGFAASEISFTGSSISHRDVARVGDLPIRFNVDSISTLHKVGHQFPGRSIGLRINPQIGVGMSSQLTYAGARASKFGIYSDRFEEAMRLARSYGLQVDGVHMHVGSGWLARGLETFVRAVERLCDFAEEIEGLKYINVGGGIGVPHGPADEPVDLDLYARTITRIVHQRLGKDVEICCEPGDYLVNDTSIMAAEVTMVEEKGGTLFVGLDVGFNSNPQAAHYGFRHEVLHTTSGMASPDATRYSVVGNINEVIDVFEHQASLPPVHEGDVLALLNTGGYGSSMQSNHCLRDPAVEMLLD